MPKSKTVMDKSRISLNATVIKLTAQREDMAKNLDNAKSELAEFIDKVLQDQTGDMKLFRDATGYVEMFSTLLTELDKRIIDAKLALWRYDLDVAETSLKQAGQKLSEARNAVLMATDDRVRYLRELQGSRADPDRLGSYTIMLSDAKVRAREAEQAKSNAKRELQEVRENFNQVCAELGAEPVELMSTMQLLSTR